MNLGEFLKSPRPAFDYVAHDCSRWLDRWLVNCGHPSVMDEIGRTYDSERGAMRVIVRGGGLLAIWTRNMEGIGLMQTEEPQQGDAAIMAVPTDDGYNRTTGIWTGQRWVSVHRHGLIFGVGSPLAIWRV
ncbi:hypothetical protein [Sphingobium sp.]|uniref:DUF6950 family protein n=1 Tax=Sphingobium sp. TaxID=1912891 RepID=UPI00257CBEDE|nr:hypothetical protein [Sphingobium sp.]MBR2268485.1 hypothetical protein [Sphingobium sp.]